MISKVKLVNWRSHLSSELQFTEGTNALLGHMGSGKSSILDSICFGLFGTFPALQSKKLKLDKIIMSKPAEKDRAEVEVYFQANNNQYSVKRIIEKRKGTTYSEIRENGRLLEAPSTQRVNEIVEKMLKVNYELFAKAIYSEQNALDYFLTIPKGQRMRKIDELLMMDKFEKARANSLSLSNKMLERKLGKQSSLDKTDPVSIERSLDELKKVVETLSLEKNDLAKSLETVSYDKQRLEKELSELSKVVESLHMLKSEENSLKNVLDEVMASINFLKTGNKSTSPESIQDELKNLNKVIQEFEQVLSEQQRKYQKLQEQNSKANAEVEILKQEKIDRLEAEIKEQLKIKNELEKLQKSVGGDVDKELEEEKLRLEKFVGQVEALKIKIKDLQDTLEQLSSLGAKCPICERKLTKEKKIILYNQKKAQVENLMEELGKSVKKREVSSKQIKELEVAAKKLDEMISKVKNLDGLREELENSKHIFLVLKESSTKLSKELKQIEAYIEKLQKRFKDAVETKQEMEITYLKSKQYEEKSKRFSELSDRRQIIMKHIKEAEENLAGKEMPNLQNQFQQLIRKESEMSARIVSLETLMKEKNERLDEYSSRLTVINKEKSEIQKLDRMVNELQIFGKALEHTQIELRKEFVSGVNYTMNKIWHTLYPYADYPSIRLFVEEGDYVLQLQSISGDWNDVEGILSGGERSLAALALRIAFSLILAPQLRILILDEPTANLDSKAITELATTLRERIGDFIGQTFLITHTHELEDAVNGMAYKLERDKSTDAPTNIIQLN